MPLFLSIHLQGVCASIITVAYVTTIRSGVLMVMLKYLNELSFYYLAAQTEELAQVQYTICLSFIKIFICL